ncbi:MAG: aminotransferase class V-fold PLP-dependent enzyme [Bacteroidales bacterium]|jgi:cysteine desulfurase family protein (TIGR01976 family)|nr:aminotransferase class V-fold PLP-dependent enzyme [Bacteroidales bacterium]
MLNLDYIRSQFPGLETDWVLFDNAGGSQIARPVVDRINEHFYTSNVQLDGSYPHSVLAEERHEEAHRKLAGWINAADPKELILGSSTSLLVKILADNFRRILRDGDEIIVTNCDHEANIGAWRDLANYGFTVKEWKLNPDTLKLENEDLEDLLTEKTRLVAFTAASNVLGMLNPVKEFTRTAHKYNALVCVDAVAFTPHRLIDVQESDVDFIVFSFYKTYGPHYAMMYGKLNLLEALPGFNHFFIKEPPYKFQPGNYNFEFCHGLGALPDYFEGLAERHGYEGVDSVRDKFKYIYSLIAEHEEELCIPVMEYLIARNDIRIIGPGVSSSEIRVPTISFVQKNRDSREITLKTDEHRVAIRWGHFYAYRLIRDLGLDKQNGVVRISMVHYNNQDETKRLLEALDYAL